MLVAPGETRRNENDESEFRTPKGLNLNSNRVKPVANKKQKVNFLKCE